MLQKPDPAQEQHLLRDGYWDRTAIIKASDGSLRVRKISKGSDSAGPWGRDNLRAEARYLTNLEEPLVDFFPTLIQHWDGASTGYDMAYMEGYVDVGQVARNQLFSQAQADAMQRYLGSRLLQQVHVSSDSTPCLVANIKSTFNKALGCLQAHPQLHCLVHSISVNGLPVNTLEQQLSNIFSGALLPRMDASPQVRLHGDLFLENMLLPAVDPGVNWPQLLVLIDPISVAGIGTGHPLFDLGKYESYATGELPAMRQERLRLEGFEESTNNLQPGQYRWAIDWQDNALAGFKNINWHNQLRQLYVQHYGPIDRAMYELLQAYYAAAMVVCTTGKEQQARTLKMRSSLQLALT
ncbi:MAG: phosphotransferase [Gammaproteobacteria bacterium]|jgi:hypothetical protein|nr:phosphotransferase [Gammaproteobacteria bacterium]MCP4880111.1 phosphotransferase [Gammaproteobacteria bacterium]MDP6164705.1 phosphotransferase [Gammaproteobacteria bacterium]